MEVEKRTAAYRACDLVEDGTVIGLGTGSTVRFFLERLAGRVADGLDVVGVPTSSATERLAAELGIPLTTLDEHPLLDMDIDGADEISPSLDLIKGGGGALTREKIVAAASDHVVIIADHSKVVDHLGAFPLPVEVLPFGWRRTAMEIEAMGGRPEIRRRGDTTFVTDNGHYILDCGFDRIDDPGELERSLDAIPGVVECGLFVGLARTAIIGESAGTRIMRR